MFIPEFKSPPFPPTVKFNPGTALEKGDVITYIINK
jgi:hypothetical protein